MTTERLTTLQSVKDWLDIPDSNTASDAQLTRIIDAASRFVFSYINRDSFIEQSYTQNFYGNGKAGMLLRNWPVTGITSVGINGTAIPAAVFNSTGYPTTSGYDLSEERGSQVSVGLHGYRYLLGTPCRIVYTSGYSTTENYTIVAAADPAVTNTFTPSNGGQWIYDEGVTIDGVAATLVTTVPTAGQYSIDAWGTYTFADADVGKVAVMHYSYAPWDISFATTELIGEWYRRKDRIGMLSKTLGGQETVSFTQKDMNDSVREMLQSYRNVVPV
jgi:hypothetical protein